MMDEQCFLLPGERVDDLQFQGLRIIQSPDAFRFSMDSVLLADFCTLRGGMRICDLGTGTGILPLLLYGRGEKLTFDAVEIQKDAAERAERSVRLNHLEGCVTVHAEDLRQAQRFLPHAAYDLVVCNPPYSAADAALLSPNPALRGARQESLCTLEDILRAAEWLLKNRGRFTFMLPAARLQEAAAMLENHRFHLKRLRLVHGKADRPARLALMEAMTDCGSGVQVLPPLIVKNEDGTDTDEIKRIYHL